MSADDQNNPDASGTPGLRRALYWATLGAVFVVLNLLVVQKEQLLANGQTVLLPLAPVDPRSLMQGDYMVLRYEAVLRLEQALGKAPARDGKLVLNLDGRQVATFHALDSGQQLTANQVTLRFRVRDEIRLGAESFFFQEGKADHYATAKYGELKVTPTGDAVLVGLRGPNLEKL